MTCAVYFNLDGTLTENTLNFEQIYAQALEKSGISGLEDSYKEYTDKFFTYFQNGWAFPRRQAITDILDEHNIQDLGESDAFGDAWEDVEAEQTTFRTDASNIVQRIAERHSVGIVTNGTSRLQRMKVTNAGLADTIDALVISSEVGKTKPNSEFFEEAKNALDADTHIIVSDDLRRDILPAKRLDLKTVWITDAKKDAENNPQIQQLVDAQITSLNELPDVIDELCEAQ